MADYIVKKTSMMDDEQQYQICSPKTATKTDGTSVEIKGSIIELPMSDIDGKIASLTESLARWQKAKEDCAKLK